MRAHTLPEDTLPEGTLVYLLLPMSPYVTEGLGAGEDTGRQRTLGVCSKLKAGAQGFPLLWEPSVAVLWLKKLGALRG